jgi:tRNA(Ile)-lysidine synthase
VALDLDYLEKECDRIWPGIAAVVPSVMTEDGNGGGDQESVRFDRAGLAALHPAMQRQLLRKGLVQLLGDTRRLEESHLASITMILQQDRSGFRLDLPRGLWLHVTYDAVELSRSAILPCPLPAIEGQHRVELPNPAETSVENYIETRVGNWRIRAGIVPDFCPGRQLRHDSLTAFFDAESMKNGVWVRTRKPGDRFQPLGMNMEKKLQDFFTDSKVPGYWRDRVPLLMSGQDIAWVVGHRIADWARVKIAPATDSPVLKVEFSR